MVGWFIGWVGGWSVGRSVGWLKRFGRSVGGWVVWLTDCLLCSMFHPLRILSTVKDLFICSVHTLVILDFKTLINNKIIIQKPSVSWRLAPCKP